MWEPGDRIFLFGFSRGAYTVRCLAAVLGQCGVPTTMVDGTPLRRDVGTTTRIAREAVKQVYQHVSSPKDKDYDRGWHHGWYNHDRDRTVVIRHHHHWDYDD
jgi:hypothetical protein